MSYAGSFNGFNFGDGTRPGASVKALSGWLDAVAEIPATTGANWNMTSGPRRPPGEPRLVLNLHASNAAQYESLVESALSAFQPSATDLPLTIDGWSKWVKVRSAVPAQQPDWPGVEVTTEFTVQMVAADPTRYEATQTEAAVWSAGSPVSSAAFEAANTGRLVANARRAWDFRMTARGGAVVDPWMRVDHADGTFEQITFVGTLGSGLTLTVGADRIARIGSQIVSARVRSLTELGIVSRAPRWWLLHPSDGSDDANEVTVGAASGTFSGYVKTRGTR